MCIKIKWIEVIKMFNTFVIIIQTGMYDKKIVFSLYNGKKN